MVERGGYKGEERGAQKNVARLQELAWLGIEGGPPTCSSSLALRMEARTKLLVGCGLGLWLVHAPRATFHPEALEAVQLKLKGIPSHELGLRIVSICAIPPDDKKSCPAIAVALAPCNDSHVEGCAVHLYGAGLDAGANLLQMADKVQCLPLEMIPVLVKSLAWLDKAEFSKGEAVFQHALVAFGCNRTCKAWARDTKGVFASCGDEGMHSKLPELGLLRDISPVMSMDVKYMGYERHVAAGGVHGGLFFSVVDMRTGAVVCSSLIHLDGPVPSVALFSSSRHLDAAICDLPPEFEVNLYRESPEEAVERACGGEKVAVDAHMLACSAVGFAVIYPNISRIGFKGGSALPGMSCGEHDSVISVCSADLDLDGRVEAMLGTYCGHVMQYDLGDMCREKDDDEAETQQDQGHEHQRRLPVSSLEASHQDEFAEWKVEAAAREKGTHSSTQVGMQGQQDILASPEADKSPVRTHQTSQAPGLQPEGCFPSLLRRESSEQDECLLVQRSISMSVSSDHGSLIAHAESLSRSFIRSVSDITHSSVNVASEVASKSPSLTAREARVDSSHRLGWLKDESSVSPHATLSQVLQAGGAVYGLFWVDLTADGMRELAIVLHNGVRILQPDIKHHTERLRYALDQLLHLRELEEAALNLSASPITARRTDVRR